MRSGVRTSAARERRRTPARIVAAMGVVKRRTARADDSVNSPPVRFVVRRRRGLSPENRTDYSDVPLSILARPPLRRSRFDRQPRPLSEPTA